MDTLEAYIVSRSFGFVLERPLRRLPGACQPWQELMNNFRSIMKEKGLQKAVTALPLIDPSCLSSHEELRLAHLQLAMLTSAYVWCGGVQDPPKTLPRNIAVPFFEISRRLGLPPVITYADLVAANIYVTAEKSANIQNPVRDLGLIYKFSCSANWESLLCEAALIEIRFSDAIPHILRAAETSKYKNRAADLRDELKAFANAIRDLRRIMELTESKLDHEFYFYHIQPFLRGWNAEVPALAKGLYFDGVSDDPIVCSSASVAQSPILPTCDALLGISSAGEARTDGIISEHQRFIEDLRRVSLVRQRVLESNNRSLADEYVRAVAIVNLFRTDHRNLVVRCMNNKRQGRIVVL